MKHTPLAERDIEEAMVYLELQQAGLAEEFLQDVLQTCELLATQPHMGVKRNYSRDVNIELRIFPLRQFKKHILVYSPLENGVSIIRVLRTAREIDESYFK